MCGELVSCLCMLNVLTILDSAVDLMISVEFLVEMSGRDENSRFRGEVQFGAYYSGL